MPVPTAIKRNMFITAIRIIALIFVISQCCCAALLQVGKYFLVKRSGFTLAFEAMPVPANDVRNFEGRPGIAHGFNKSREPIKSCLRY
jgi:hypothetical protein